MKKFIIPLLTVVMVVSIIFAGCVTAPTPEPPPELAPAPTVLPKPGVWNASTGATEFTFTFTVNPDSTGIAEFYYCLTELECDGVWSSAESTVECIQIIPITGGQFAIEDFTVARPYEVPELGTWTWSSTGTYDWHWRDGIVREVHWPARSREIPVNIVSLEYRTFRFYAAPGDTFDNREVTGSTWWYTNAHNYPDGTEEPITGLELSLDSNLSLDWRRWFMKTILTEVPPTYEWSVGDVLEDEHVPVVVHPRGPDEVLATFTPGFDASVSVDRVKFSQSEGTQTQTLTIEVTPLEDVNVAVCADEGTFSLFMPADKGDLVEAKITSFPSGGTALEDGHTFYMPISGGETTTIELGIEVTPKVPRAEYKPAVAVMSPPEGTYPAGEPHLGSSHSLEVDSLGTWTWSAVGEYNWTWNYVVLEGVMFAGISSAIEDFHVGERWSLTVRGRFDETGRHASGTWEISSEGTICAEGTWEASAP